MVKACNHDGEDRMISEQFLCSLSMGKMKDRMLAQEYDLREQALMAAECEESTTVAINERSESEISLNRAMLLLLQGHGPYFHRVPMLRCYVCGKWDF